VMFSDDALDNAASLATIGRLVALAHAQGAAVEGELAALPGVGGDMDPLTESDLHLTDPDAARRFVAATGIDALAVNVGQMHLHGRRLLRLDLDRLRELAALPVALVLHGATSIAPADVQAAIGIGVRKINVGSRLKQAFLSALREACRVVPEGINPYEAIGSGLDGDVLLPGRRAMAAEVARLMHLFGSAGRAKGWRPA
jgi:fructose-bisphosphate aldolase class II